MKPAMIARYRIIRRLGGGGMGEVYLAQDTELDRHVALKVMSAELARNENQRKRFRTEARAASGLTHPNVSVVHEVGETEDGRPFLAMEYIEGETLDRLMQKRRLKIREIIRCGMEVASALDAAHRRGLIHRDIKPGNIMLTSSGAFKVLDFGLAKRFGTEPDGLTGSSAAHTQSGMLIGTPHYMSPEQTLGRDLDARSDIFSLGSVLYELVTGVKAFGGRGVGEVINAIVNATPEPLGLENPAFSPRLDQIIFKCLEKDPARRYANGAELTKDLSTLQKDSQRALESTGPTVRTEPAAAGCGSSTATPTPPDSTADANCVCVPRGIFGVSWARIAAVLVVVAIGGAGFALWRSHQLGTEAKSLPPTANDRGFSIIPKKSVAVLPFDNFSADADLDYLSDGLTEEITTALSRVPGLKVAARNSAFAFKGKKEDLHKTAQALQVRNILRGSIRRSGNELRITAQLINADDGYQLWSDTYPATADDMFKVQQEIANRIAERLQGGPATNAPPLAVARDPEAHKLYLQGRLFWNKRSEPGLKRAIQLFQQAIEKDPTYAEAHAALASSYFLLPIYSMSSSAKQFTPLARAAALRAQEIDPSSAEACVVLAELHGGDDPARAEEQYKRAIKLNPNFATAHHWYGRFLGYCGRREEGLAELRKAIDLDPLSPVIQSTICEWYYLGKDFKQAIVEARRVMEAFADFVPVRRLLIAAQLRSGDYAGALKEIEDLRALQPSVPRIGLDMKAYALARSGHEPEARTMLAEFQRLKEAGENVNSELLWSYMGLRECDHALDILEELIRGGESIVTYAHDPFSEDLRDLPRFQALMNQSRILRE